VLDQASKIGLRTLTLSEASGGAGADQLTACIVLEELAAGDVDVAIVLAETARLAPLLFDESLSPEQRKRFLPEFSEDARFHLARVSHDPAATHGWHYHRATEDKAADLPTAVRQNGELRINGSCTSVSNAPVAQLFAIDVNVQGEGVTTVLVSRQTPGFSVNDATRPFENSGAMTRWKHGACAAIAFKDCRVPEANTIAAKGGALARGQRERSALDTAAVNLGLGRAAFETAVDYAKLRVQGGRPIIEHQAIGTIIADCSVKLENARNLLWKAAWSLDNPDATNDRSIADLPLASAARVYTAQAMNEVALGAAECFGAMGVMRDMPLQKYVHDSFIFLHSADHDSTTKLEIAERVAGFERQDQNVAPQGA
jgi:alkylation response protein AidB-like acyl-CoA dehydrogenase